MKSTIAKSTDSAANAHATSSGHFPHLRLRRLRGSAEIRSMLQETHLRKEQLIYPLFITEAAGIKKPISSMPGIHQQSIDAALFEIEEVAGLGLTSVILFGIPDEKDPEA